MLSRSPADDAVARRETESTIGAIERIHDEAHFGSDSARVCLLQNMLDVESREEGQAVAVFLRDKSTLMKILAGAYMPDNGEIILEGKPVQIEGPRHARELGISMVYQDLALFNSLDVASNIFVAREPTTRVLGLKLFDRKEMRREARALLDRMGVDISSVDLPVARMSGGQRQMIAAARALAFAAKILLLDEPTAALGVREANTLLKQIREWKAHGLSIILITQRIPDVLAVGDRVMVLKGGVRQDILEVGERVELAV